MKGMNRSTLGIGARFARSSLNFVTVMEFVDVLIHKIRCKKKKKIDIECFS